MLFYFHFLYSFPFNVISVATFLCFCSFHPPVVSTLLWFPSSHGFHLSMVSTLCGYSGLHPPVICIFPWLLMVSLPWFALSWFTLCHGFHPPIVPTLPVVTPWYPFCGLHFHGLHSAVVSTLLWFASSHGSHPPCGYSMVSLLWFALLWFTLCCGFHPPVVCIFTWFPPSLWLLRGVPFVVCTIAWFTLCHGFDPLVVTPWCPSWILA